MFLNNDFFNEILSHRPEAWNVYIQNIKLLGNSNYYNELMDICKDNNIILIEDNCESLGAKYDGKYLGTIGLMGTYSTFYSHHMCTMEGGVVVTEDRELYEYMLAIRAHG